MSIAGSSLAARANLGFRLGLCLFLGLNPSAAPCATITVHVFDVDFSVNPQGQPAIDPVIDIGDTIHWVWDQGMHSVTSVKGSIEAFDSQVQAAGHTYDHTFEHAGRTVYYCQPHGTDLGNG